MRKIISLNAISEHICNTLRTHGFDHAAALSRYSIKLVGHIAADECWRRAFNNIDYEEINHTIVD